MSVGQEIKLRVQRGKFNRSMAAVGVMDPFVVLSPNSESSKNERAKYAKKHNLVSAAHSGGHLEPKWNWDFPQFRMPKAKEILLDVYDRNKYHKNTFMGTAKLSLNDVSEGVNVQNYPCSVLKNGQETGIIWLSMSVPGERDVRDMRQSHSMEKFPLTSSVSNPLFGKFLHRDSVTTAPRRVTTTPRAMLLTVTDSQHHPGRGTHTAGDFAGSSSPGGAVSAQNLHFSGSAKKGGSPRSFLGGQTMSSGVSISPQHQRNHHGSKDERSYSTRTSIDVSPARMNKSLYMPITTTKQSETTCLDSLIKFLFCS